MNRMSVSGRNGTGATKTPQQPVIVNTSLKQSEFLRHLQQQQQLKLRFSDSTVVDSAIFPRSGVAFLLVPLQSAVTTWPSNNNTQLNSELLQRFDKMAQVHRNSSVLLVAPLYGKKEMEVLSQLQIRYINKSINMIPCHNVGEAVQIMLDIAKMSGRVEPAAGLLRGRLELELERKADPLLILKQIGLTNHETQVLQDSLGSIRKVVSASEQVLLTDTSLDKESVAKIKNFMKKDQSLL